MHSYMNRRLVAITLVVVLASLMLTLSPARASAANFLQLTGVTGSSCTPGIFVSVSLTWATPAPGTMHRWSLSNPSAGTVTIDEFVNPASGGSGSYSVAVPAGTVAGDTLVMRVIVDPVGTELGSYAELTFNCTTGAVSSNIFIQDYSPAVAGPGYVGPAIPEGYVLRTITCDVAVFDTPGGEPVGGNRITAGQTWFVNPTTKDDASGKSWTQVFVSSTTHPWIPTSCVGGAPAGY